MRRLGGIDFGFRNPFAAVWGIVDRDSVLYLTGEHYARNQLLAYPVEHLWIPALRQEESGATCWRSKTDGGLLFP